MINAHIIGLLTRIQRDYFILYMYLTIPISISCILLYNAECPRGLSNYIRFGGYMTEKR